MKNYNIEYWNQSCVQWNSVLENELCNDKQDNCVWTQNYSDKRRWCSGIMQDSHFCDPGSIPGRRKLFKELKSMFAFSVFHVSWCSCHRNQVQTLDDNHGISMNNVCQFPQIWHTVSLYWSFITCFNNISMICHFYAITS